MILGLFLAAIGTDSLHLADALARARTVRPRVLEARATVAEARGVLREAGTIPNPTVNYSHSGSTPRDHVLADQPFDWLLRRGPERRAARFGVQRAEADSVQLAAELARDVRLAFYGALAAGEGLRLAVEQAHLADSLSMLAAKRLAAGDVSLLEREQVGQEALRATALVSRAREADRVARAALVRALAWVGRDAPEPAGDLAEGLDAPLDTALASLDLVPAVRQATADSAASAALRRAAAIGRLPVPSVQAGADWNDPTLDRPRTQGVIGLAVPVPLWNLGNGRLASARARADRDAARASEARLEVTQLLAAQRARLVEAASRARFARDALVPTARRVRERVIRGFAAGETDVLPVLDALRAEREATLALVQELRTYQEAIAEWYALTGQDR